MPPLNYERLKVLVEIVEEEEGLEKLGDEEAEEWFTELSQVKIENEREAERLSLLFRGARAIMDYKAAQYTAAIEQAEEDAKEALAREEDLIDKNQTLQEEISHLRIDLSAGSTGQEVNALRDEISSLQGENDKLKYEQRERLREIADTQAQSERYLSQVTDLEKDLRDLRDQRLELMNKTDELTRRLRTYEEGQAGTRSQSEQLQRRQNELRSQLLQQVDELTNLTSANESLKSQVEELKSSLEEATVQMEKTTEQNLRLKEALKETDDALEVLKNENSQLRNQSQNGKTSELSGYEDLMAAVDKKIEQWKALLQSKDEEIVRNKQEIEKLKQEITEYNIDTDRVSVAALSRAVEDRDKQIYSFKQELEKATKDMLEVSATVESLQAQLLDGGSSSSVQNQRLSELLSSVKQNEKLLANAVERAEKAEKAAVDRDKQFGELLAKMHQYEQGIAGLPEAVDEIKHLKEQILFRDKQISELNQRCSELQVEAHEISEENNELRERLGLSRKEAIELKHKKGQQVQSQTDRAMNIILQKEIDKLEDERIDMKMQLRKMSQRLGQRAAALGLSADDLLAVEQFTEELKQRREAAINEWKKSRLVEKDSSPIRKESTSNGRFQLTEQLQQENKELRNKLSKMEVETRNLIHGVQNIRDNLTDRDVVSIESADSVSLFHKLDELIGKVSSQELSASTDMELRFRMEEMTGRLEEARSELQRTQDNLQETKIDLRKAETEIARLEESLKEAKVEADSSNEQLKILQLPEGLPPSSSLLIMNLNEHLIKTLQESEIRDEQFSRMEAALQSYQSKMAVLKHSQGLLYQECNETKEAWQKDRNELEKKNRLLAEQQDCYAVTKQEHERLLDSLKKDESEIIRRLEEMTRKFTVMRMNEKKMTRKYKDLQLEELSLRQELKKEKDEAVLMERSVREKIAYLQRQKETNCFELASLHKTIENSVPVEEFKAQEKELLEMTGKYRLIMEENCSRMTKPSKDDIENDMLIRKLEKENVYLKNLLQAEKERNVKHEEVYNKFTGVKADVENGANFAERIAMLEMKELNEREKAEHAQHLYDSQRNELWVVQERNITLERKLQELGQINLDLQKKEQELRDELCNCVPQSVDKANRARIQELESASAGLKADNDNLKLLAEVAKSQSDYWQKIEHLRNTELYELRSIIRDLQAESDEKTVIARLHREIIHFKLSERDTEEQLKICQSRLKEVESRLLRAEQRCDNKDRQIHNLSTSYAHRLSQARKTISSLRTRYSGAITVKEQERFHQSVVQINKDKQQIKMELLNALEKAEETEERLEEMKEKEKGLEELTAALKNSDGFKKLSEWHDKMEKLKLREMKLNRRISRLVDQNSSYEGEISKLEKQLDKLEEDNVSLVKRMEQREIEWEAKEAMLEAQLNQLQEGERWEDKELTEAEISGLGLLDSTLPLTVQLEQSLLNLRKQIKVTSTYRKEIDTMKKTLQEVEEKNKKLHADLLTKQNLSLYLESALPKRSEVSSGEVDQSSTKSTVASQLEWNRLSQAVNAMQTLVEGLKTQLAEKEEIIENYKRLLRSAKKELSDAELRHQDQLKDVRNTEHIELKQRLQKMKEDSDKLFAGQNGPDETEKQLLKVAELEDTIVEQENAITSLVGKLKQVKAEKDELVEKNKEIQLVLHKKRHSVQNGNEKEIENENGNGNNERSAEIGESLSPTQKTEDDHYEDDFDVTDEIITDKVSRENVLTKRKSEPSVVGGVSDKHQSANVTTSTTTTTTTTEYDTLHKTKVEKFKESRSLEWKVKYDRIRKQLEQAKKENQGLNRALVDMKNSLLSSKPSRDLENGMKELEIKDLKLKVKELEEKVGKQADDLRRDKSRENDLVSELQELKGELSRKDGIVMKLKQDKLSLEKENDSLERRITHIRESMKYKILETENKELKKKITLLEKQNKAGQKVVAEKPLENEAATGKVNDSRSRWEEAKKWQRLAERNKEKLNEKTQEAEEKQLFIDRLKQRISRLEHEKLAAENVNVSSQRRFTGSDTSQRGNYVCQAESVERDLRLEVERLKSVRSSEVGAEQELAALQAENLAFEEKCAALQEKLKNLTHTAASLLESGRKYVQFQPSTLGSCTDLEGIINLLQNVLSEAEKENTRLESQLTLTEMERVKEKQCSENIQSHFEQLQKELKVLQDENEILKEELDASASRPGTIETINRQHVTIEKLESEKKDLVRQLEEYKLSSARITDADMERIVKENKELKQKLSRTIPRVAWAEESRLQNGQQAASSKLVCENQSLSKELQKEQKENQRLNKHLWEVKDAYGKLENEFGRLQHLSNQKRKWSPGSFNNRILEEKLKAKESTLEFKESRIEQLEALLHQEIDKYHRTVFENNRMKEKLRAFEWVPAQPFEAHDFVNEIRNLRVQNSNLRTENMELKAELEVINRYIKPAVTPSNELDMFSVKERLKTYDRVLKENVELKLQCQR